MQLIQRILCVALALVMLIGLVPVFAAAQTEENAAEQIHIDQYYLDMLEMSENWDGEIPDVSASVEWPSLDIQPRSTDYSESENNDTTSLADRIYNDYVVNGSLSSRDLLDIYKFVLSGRSEIVLAAASDRSTLMLGIMNTREEFVAIAFPYEYNDGVYTYLVLDENYNIPVLNAGTYYVVAMDENESSNIYAFNIMWEAASSHTHSFGAWTVTIAPTCTEKGVEERECACGQIETREVEEKGHNYADIITPPTCTEQGYTTYHCANCGITFQDKFVEAVGHSYENGICTECGAVDESYQEKFSLFGSSMTLGNALDMNFFVYQSDIKDTGNYAVITKHYADGRADAVVTVAQKDWLPLGNVYYYFTFSGVRAKEMADEIEVVIYNAEGDAISEVFVDSVQGYARRMLDNPETAATHRTLYIEMLNYGAAAQVEFKYDTGNLANSVITAAEQRDYGMAKRTYVNSRVADAAYFGTTLTLENQIVFNIFFNGSYVTDGSYAVASFVNHKGQQVEEKVTSFETVASYKYASFKSLVVADCSELITVKLYNANGKLISTVVDSIEGYAARMTSVGPLYEAVMKFADAAYEYFHGCRHIWGEWHEIVEPTYTSEGEQARSCLKCAVQEFQSIPKLEVAHSDLYIEGVTVEQVISAYNEVITYSYDIPMTKWTKPVYYYIVGSPTQTDRNVVDNFAAAINKLDNFPGMYKASSQSGANLVIRFCAEGDFYKYVGDWAYGVEYEGVFSYNYDLNSYNITDAVVCLDRYLSQTSRSSMLMSMLYHAMGPDADTWTRSDSIIYSYVHDTDVQALSDMDWLLLELLYHPDMKCGYTESQCEKIIRKLYY